ncbi:MAG: hypothetical protein IJM30_08215 [Thermoguttaceae bacterium]|nr:hypothetical protein [Thermoguttaceae bacterium]
MKRNFYEDLYRLDRSVAASKAPNVRAGDSFARSGNVVVGGSVDSSRRLTLEKNGAAPNVCESEKGRRLRLEKSAAKRNPIAAFISERSKSVFVKVPVWIAFIALIVVSGLALGMFPIIAIFRIAAEAKGMFPNLVLAHYYYLILALTISATIIAFEGFYRLFGSVIDPDKKNKMARLFDPTSPPPENDGDASWIYDFR